MEKTNYGIVPLTGAGSWEIRCERWEIRGDCHVFYDRIINYCEEDILFRAPISGVVVKKIKEVLS